MDGTEASEMSAPSEARVKIEQYEFVVSAATEKRGSPVLKFMSRHSLVPPLEIDPYLEATFDKQSLRHHLALHSLMGYQAFLDYSTSKTASTLSLTTCIDPHDSMGQQGIERSHTTTPLPKHTRFEASALKSNITKSDHLTDAVSDALKDGIAPQLVNEGSGGTYFIARNNEAPFAVFKPLNEEAKAPLNPKGNTGLLGQPSLRQGIRSGEAFEREVAAYLIDREHFAGVPYTTVAYLQHPSLFYGADTPMIPKQGSLQEFVVHDDCAGNFSPALFPSSEVHKIGILDIRLVNTDRNEENILVRKKGSSFELTPIDHGYCLPDQLEIAWCDWAWIDWPQAREPFNEATKKYIENIDIEEDIERLRSTLSVREKCLTNMRIMTMLLKMAAVRGLTLQKIAKIICRDTLDAPSLLEITVAQARALARNTLLKQADIRTPTRNRSSSASECDIGNTLLQVSHSRSDSTTSCSFDIPPKDFEAVFLQYLESLMLDLVMRKASNQSFRKKYSIKKRASGRGRTATHNPYFTASGDISADDLASENSATETPLDPDWFMTMSV